MAFANFNSHDKIRSAQCCKSVYEHLRRGACGAASRRDFCGVVICGDGHLRRGSLGHLRRHFAAPGLDHHQNAQIDYKANIVTYRRRCKQKKEEKKGISRRSDRPGGSSLEAKLNRGEMIENLFATGIYQRSKRSHQTIDRNIGRSISCLDGSQRHSLDGSIRCARSFSVAIKASNLRIVSARESGGCAVVKRVRSARFFMSGHR